MWFQFRPYVPVAQRRAKAAREVASRVKKGQKVSPIVISGRKITETFWGNSWCENLEAYSDFANRLPRGRTYVRNGSVVDLQIAAGKITALVSGSSLYNVTIEIAAVAPADWQKIKSCCSGQIGSLVELLQGKLSKGVMNIVTAREGGLFPKPREIKMKCSCPDYAGMCKHIAAVMYGVGSRLDTQPELLFKLRKVDHLELIDAALPAAAPKKSTKKTLAGADLADVFGIDMTMSGSSELDVPPVAKRRSKKVEKPVKKAARPSVSRPAKKAKAAAK